MSISINYSSTIGLHGVDPVITSKNLIEWITSYNDITVTGKTNFNNDIQLSYDSLNFLNINIDENANTIFNITNVGNNNNLSTFIYNNKIQANNGISIKGDTIIGDSIDNSLFINSNIYINNNTIFNDVFFKDNIRIGGNLNITGTMNNSAISTNDITILGSNTNIGLTIDNTNTSNNSIINFKNNGNTIYSIGYSGSNQVFQICNSDFDSQPRITINSSGNVGIGTDNPTEKLHINGTTNVTGATNIGGTLDVTGATNINNTTTSTSTTTGALIVDGGVGIADNTNIGGTLDVTGATNIGGTLDVTGATNIGGTLDVTGATNIHNSTVSNKVVENNVDLLIEDDNSRLQLISTDSGAGGSYIALSNALATPITTPSLTIHQKNWVFHHSGPNQDNKLGIYYRENGEDQNNNINTESLYILSTTGLTLDTSGNVGIGTSNPEDKLDVSGDIRLTGEMYFDYPRIFTLGSRDATGGGSGTKLVLQAKTNGKEFQMRNQDDLSCFAFAMYNHDELPSPSGSSIFDVYSAKDVVSRIGYAFIGYPGVTGNAGFGHINMFGNDQKYALRQTGLGATVLNSYNNDLFFRINNSDKMLIDTSGNVGIGTSIPAEKLHVNGKILADNITSSEINLSPNKKIIANSIDISNTSATSQTSNIVLLEIFANTTSTTISRLYAGSIDIEILGKRNVSIYSENILTTKLHFSLSWHAQSQTFSNNKFILENKTVSDGTYDTYTLLQGISEFKYKYDNSTKKYHIYVAITHKQSNINISYSSNVSSVNVEDIYIPSSNTLMSTGTSYDIEPSICYDNDGNVGIGTDNPTEKLHVNGDSRIDGTISYGSTNKTASLYIKGTGLNNAASRLVILSGETIVNNSDIGLTLTIINGQTLEHVSSTSYDTYNSTTNSNNLATAINNMTHTQIGILTSYDSFTRNITSDLRTAAMRVGLTKLSKLSSNGQTNYTTREPYAAIFYGTSSDNDSDPQYIRDVIEIYRNNEDGDGTNLDEAPPAIISTTLSSDGNYAGIAGASSVNALWAASPGIENPALICDKAGNVGIGTTDPTEKLHVNGNGEVLRLQGTDHSYISFYPQGNTTRHAYIGVPNASSNDFTISNEASGDMIFRLGSNSEKMRILNNGNVGIGTTNPSSRLHIEDSTSAVAFTINNTISSNDSIINFNNLGSTQYSMGYDSSLNTFQICDGNFSNSSIFRINSNKITVGSSNTSYDINNFNISGSFYFAKQGSNFDYSNNNFGGTGPNIRIGDYMYLGHTRTNNFPYIAFNGYLSSSTYVSGGTSYNRWQHKYHNGTDSKITLITANTSGGISIKTANTTGNEIEENGYETTSNFTNIVHIGNTGNVGIGTTNPSSGLHVYRNTTSYRQHLILENGQDIDNNIYMISFKTPSIINDDETDQCGLGVITNDNNRQIWSDRSYSMTHHFSSNAEWVIKTSGWTSLFGIRNDRVYIRDKLGIGTTNPSSKLHIYNYTVSNKVVEDNVDLLIEDAEARLQIISTDSGAGGSLIALSNAPSSGSQKNWVFHHNGPSVGNKLGIYYKPNTGTDSLWQISNIGLTLDTSGNVGIGTSSPTEKLEVNGNINITGFLKINNLNFCKIIYIGSTVISDYQSASGTGSHTKILSTNYDDNNYSFAPADHFNPDPSNYTIGYYLSSNLWTTSNNDVIYYYNGTELIRGRSWAGGASMFRNQVESGIWHSWYQFPTQNAYNFTTAGSTFTTYSVNSFNYINVTIHTVLIHKSYMDYPKVPNISSTYDTANYRYSNNAGTTYYNMFS